MAINAGLLERVRGILEGWPRISEKRMFGGMAFLCGGNLFLGVRSVELKAWTSTRRWLRQLRSPDPSKGASSRKTSTCRWRKRAR
jgi:hypothetical protein